MRNEKSTKKKDDRRERPALRPPSRGRGIRRFEALLDATEALLNENSPDDVGLYQIAERAEAPPASVYHFFPTKEAAFLALTLRYTKALNSGGESPLSAPELESWQSLMCWDQRNAMMYLNARPAALKLMYGGFGGIAARQADMAINRHLANLTYLRLSQAFHMPVLREVENKFHIGLEIIDAIWTISYLSEGTISPSYFEKAQAASVAYHRLFLPEHVELRDEYREMLAHGKKVILPALPPPELQDLIVPQT